VTFERFAAFLKDTIGLDTPTIGSGAIERAVRERLAARGLTSSDDYWRELNGSDAERQELIESVVVPETWFFRDPGAFTALAALAQAGSPRPQRYLSLPCSTGEEPYSIAMTLLDAGMAPASFAIDAVDISSRALEQARRGVYRKNSFRGNDLAFRERHFTNDAVRPEVRERVQFLQGNLLAPPDALREKQYEAIFCRNVLIYFDRETQDRAVAVLSGLLAPDGILFVGPSETALLLAHGFESASWPMAFACRKPRAAQAVAPLAAPPRPIAMTAARNVTAAHSATAVRNVTTARTRTRSARPDARLAREAPPVREARPARSQASAAAVSTNPPETNTQDVLKHAESLANRGELAAARECCELSIRRDGPSAQAHYLLGLLSDTEGRGAEAVDQYRRAIYLDPSHQQALVHLAMLLEQSGDRTGAQRLFDRAKRAGATGAPGGAP
jgi:chemotaxis protein methyltransferase WspC